MSYANAYIFDGFVEIDAAVQSRRLRQELHQAYRSLMGPRPWIEVRFHLDDGPYECRVDSGVERMDGDDAGEWVSPVSGIDRLRL